MKSLGVCIVAVFMSVGAATLAQTPAYCVSLSEAMEKSPQVAEAQRRLREEFRLENAELTALREKLAELEQEIQKRQASSKEGDPIGTEDELLRLIDKYNQESGIYKLRSRQMTDRIEIKKKIYEDRISAIIIDEFNDFVKERDLEIRMNCDFDSADKTDLTPDFIERLKKRDPVLP